MPGVEYDIQGTKEVAFRLRGVRGELGRQVRDLIDDVSHIALEELQLRVPRGEEGVKGDDNTISGSLGIEGPTFHPGGAGGGGIWEARVGTINNPPTHLEWVWRGTGVYGPFGVPITPTKKAALTPGGNVKGEPGIVTHVPGQRAQQEWFRMATGIAQVHFNAGIRRLHIRNT